MPRVRFRSRWLASGLLVTGSSLAFPGCADTHADRAELVLPVVRLVKMPTADGSKDAATYGTAPVSPGTAPYGITSVVQAAYRPGQPEKLSNPPSPEPVKEQKSAPMPHGAGAEEKVVPIYLDTVLRLAEEQNAQVALAREKLHESEAEQALATKAWLPKVYAGGGYYRHEGGIQDFNGNLVHSSYGSLFYGLDIKSEIDLREAVFTQVTAERQSHQSRGELSKVTSETLLEAATTYMDLLTARRGEAVARELEKYLADIAERAEKMVTPADRSAQVIVEAARAEVSGRKATIAKLHQQGDAAAIKLAYLLGMGGCARLVPVEETLAPIDLVDPTPCAAELVGRAQQNGPGVRELEAMLTAMQTGLDRVTGPISYMPVVSIGMQEGAIYAGPGGDLSPDNRWDTAVQVRWNLNEFLTAKERRRVAESRVAQARVSLDDLRGKLTAGVQEAREASLSGREQVARGAEQIQHAAAGYKLSDDRLKMRPPNASPFEVLQAIRGLELAHFNYLTAINAYNKAQIRLLVLLGPAATQGTKADGHHHHAPLGGPALKPEITPN